MEKASKKSSFWKPIIFEEKVIVLEESHQISWESYLLNSYIFLEQRKNPVASEENAFITSNNEELVPRKTIEHLEEGEPSHAAQATGL